ncbi:MAG: hypothetical protein KC933_03775 [Myxococcales bacterium]|nr:hypothetical protein [Myxococcales bacterium]MCB9647051.1 hypothetical protein [Deltaproteobacteria bacterium]
MRFDAPLLTEILRSVHQQPLKQRMTLFAAHAGHAWSGELMVIGRAVNGWAAPWTIDQIADDAGRLARAQTTLGIVEGDTCPLAWVLDSRAHPERHEGYSTSRSAFWRAIEGVCRALNIGTAEDWPSHLVWSNLYKVAPYAGGNPAATLRKAQREPCAQLIRAELAYYRPRRVLALTGVGWMGDLQPELGIALERRGPGPLEAVGRLGDVPVAVLCHPQGKPELDWVEAAITTFEEPRS